MPIGPGRAEGGAASTEDALQPDMSGPGDAPQAAMPGVAGPRRAMRVTRPRLLLSLNHSWQVRNALTIADGLVPIDQLDAATVAGRGPARHRIDARANLSTDGLGASMNGVWESGGSRGEGPATFHFADLAIVNFRLFADLERLSGSNSVLHGARISLEVANLFDSRLHVHNAFGDTPLAFQPARLDPLGRTVQLTLRKQL